ncbi:MAG: ABC transporter ATP-binding protein [Pirellulaceae bacterium]
MNNNEIYLLVELVGKICDALQVSFDRTLALRSAVETVSADAESFTRIKFVQSICSLANLRAPIEQLSLNEVRMLVAAGSPVAAILGERDSEDPDSVGDLRWLLITGVSGSSFVIFDSNAAKQKSLSTRKLAALLSLDNREQSREWILPHPVLLSDRFGEQVDPAIGQEDPVSPLTRLWRLVRLESSDVITVLIFSIVLSLLSLASPLAVEALVNTVAWGRYLQPIFVLSLILLTFLLFAAFLNSVVAYVVEILQRRIFVKLVDDLAFRVPRVNQTAWDGSYPPEMMNRFFDIITVQKAVSKLLVDGFSVVIQTLVGLAVLAFYHPWLLGFDIVLLVAMVSIIFLLGRGATYTAVNESKAKYAVANWLEEISRHPTAFKLNGGAELALHRADHLVLSYLGYRKSHFSIVIRQVIFSWVLYAFAATALLGLGGYLVVLGELTLGQLVAAELIVVLVVGAFTKIGKQLETFYDLLAAMDKLGTLLDLPLESHSKLRSVTKEPPKIVFRNVSLTIDGVNVLPEFSAEFPAGSTTALLGGLSSGKSIVVDLLAGIRSPDGGTWDWNDIDARELRLESLRESIGVARGHEVFASTLDENVHLGRNSVTGVDCKRALKTVKLLDETLALPKGMLTDLQTGGRPLTNSQVSRLMIARAIASRPLLLIIDGSLDGFSVPLVQELLTSIQQEFRATIIITTVRKSLAELCDQIVDIGDPGELGAVG